MELKYVITDNNCFALFSDTTEHISVARGLWGTPVGAGFCTIRQMADTPDDVSVHCYGRSSTLNLSAREQDEEIITKKLNQTYY